ncbi:hypothetical protein BaRGS_00018251 [Batillaria attramentaria]|uniref:Methyltransferase FkbM domain-containing protein n=1 Tax=Batillaria attramentaria TaxID=370345 RepID=A0ABD0KUG5_9CAEN
MLKRRRLLACFAVGLVCAVCLIYFVFQRGETDVDKYYLPVIQDDRFWDFGFSTSKPYLDFINPDNVHFKRMFYNGELVSKKKPPKLSPLQAEVNIFAPESLSAKHCVPLKVPSNTTLRICIHDPDVDRMISSYIKDNGVWEAEQVESMIDLMRADDTSRTMEEILSSARLREGGSDARTGQNVKSEKKVEESFDSVVVPVQNSDRSTSDRYKLQQNGISMSLVDVGCNIGMYSLSAAAMGHEALAIDPVQHSLTLLAASLHLANLTARATLLLNAVSDRRGPVDVHVNPGNIGGSSVAHRTLEALGEQNTKRFVKSTTFRRAERDLGANSLENVDGSSTAKYKKGRNQGRNRSNIGGSSKAHLGSKKLSQNTTAAKTMRPVWAVCLDDLVPHVRTRRVFLKLDIEGWEARALSCASTFFQEVDVRYVMMEWLFHRKSRDGISIINFLTRNGFLPYDDVKKGTLLRPENYYSWPDNVLWGKR